MNTVYTLYRVYIKEQIDKTKDHITMQRNVYRRSGAFGIYVCEYRKKKNRGKDVYDFAIAPVEAEWVRYIFPKILNKEKALHPKNAELKLLSFFTEIRQTK